MHKGYDYSRVANPTRTRAAGGAREPRGREARRRVQLRDRRDDDADAPRRSGRARRPDRRRLRRRLPDDVDRSTSRRATASPTSRRTSSTTTSPSYLGRRRAHGVGRDAVEPAAQRRRHPQGGGCRARRRRDARRRQHVRDAVPAAAARRSAPTPSSTRRRSTSAATATRSAASSPRTTTRSPSSSTSCRSRSARCRARSTPGSSCAGSRRSPCGCASTARTHAGSPSSSTATTPSSACSTPGSPSHPGHDVARAQMRDFGGMVSFLAHSEEEALELVARTKLFKLAESLGGVESMIEHPAPDDARVDRRTRRSRRRRTSCASRSGSSRSTICSPISRRRSSDAQRPRAPDSLRTRRHVAPRQQAEARERARQPPVGAHLGRVRPLALELPELRPRVAGADVASRAHPPPTYWSVMTRSRVLQKICSGTPENAIRRT